MKRDEMQKILDHQRAMREHRAALPGALDAARRAIADGAGQALPDALTAPLPVAVVRTLLREIERLQAQVRHLNDDVREEQLGQRDSYAQGRFDERMDTVGHD